MFKCGFVRSIFFVTYSSPYWVNCIWIVYDLSTKVSVSSCASTSFWKNVLKFTKNYNLHLYNKYIVTVLMVKHHLKTQSNSRRNIYLRARDATAWFCNLCSVFGYSREQLKKFWFQKNNLHDKAKVALMRKC